MSSLRALPSEYSIAKPQQTNYALCLDMSHLCIYICLLRKVVYPARYNAAAGVSAMPWQQPNQQYHL
jgi:hypothetical protein